MQGIGVIKPDAPAWLALSADRWLYFVTLAVTLALIALALNLVRSRTGRALLAIRDNPVAAASMGINVSLYKALAFGISAFVTGIAGALSAIVVAFVSPDSFTFVLSVALFVGLVVGGVGSTFGALFGGAFVLFAPHLAEHLLGWGAAAVNLAGHAVLGDGVTLFSSALADRLSKGLAGAVYGVILIAVVFAMPSGAAGFCHRLAARFRPHDTAARQPQIGVKEQQQEGGEP